MRQLTQLAVQLDRSLYAEALNLSDVITIAFGFVGRRGAGAPRLPLGEGKVDQAVFKVTEGKFLLHEGGLVQRHIEEVTAFHQGLGKVLQHVMTICSGLKKSPQAGCEC
ncbi:hypothetical protein [Stenotrophomonas sp. SORGH_AS_0282]|jgi:hypothetical protein|uniref:hypothetical protein n=1 Tax=Stenotrophomonas sp. SORGH_AS_0282 TaxID=3041763 RepID=UPI0027D7B524|nr:hypothetical protein [Stenotrophomonas sp. SORGH_AS_0282]